ncbi:MAG TPA: hypothetical protein VKX16_19265 [Chloroflexota bacterium]|nr:hypothetical protein [Chloroflexota bacterium]
MAALVVALILAGQAIFLVRSIGSGTLTAGTSTLHGSLTQRVNSVVAGALGPSDRGVPRFRVTSIKRERADRRLIDIAMTWAINNDLSAGTIGSGAAADVYTVLRDLYTANLSVGTVSLDGTYPLRKGSGPSRETVVMRLVMPRSVAAMVNAAGWDSLDVQTFWPLVHRLYVDPQFQPLPSE